MRFKNALRKHEVAPISETAQDTPPTEWFALATYITTITPNNNEETEDVAYYHGDGSSEVNVLSVSKAYDVEGDRYYGDEAQDLIASMEGNPSRGEDTKLWHRVTRADGKSTYTGIATASAIVADGGEAGAYEGFSCKLTYDKFPVEEEITIPAG